MTALPDGRSDAPLHRPTTELADLADWVLAAPFRSHVQQLVDQTGIRPRHLAVLVGVPTATVLRLVHPRPRHSPDRVRRRDAERLFGLDAHGLRDLAESRVGAAEGRVLAARVVTRVGTEEAVRLTGLSEGDLVTLLQSPHPTCSRLVVARLQDALGQLVARRTPCLPRVGDVGIQAAA